MNPLTYEVNALRMFMIQSRVDLPVVAKDFAVLVVTTAVLLGVASRLYARMAA
jgi:hypothetical protein